MGTLGGKVGLVAGMVVVFLTSVPMIHLVVGGCFFEEGCGPNETVGLVAAAIACLVIGLFAGLLVRLGVNALWRVRP